MTLAEAIDIVVARTKVERYRFLCLKHPRESVRRSYSEWIVHEASLDKLPNIDASLREAAKEGWKPKPCGGC